MSDPPRQVSRIPALGGCKTCTINGVDLYINPAGTNYTMPEFVPGWIVECESALGNGDNYISLTPQVKAVPLTH
eukprot:5931287-Pyramimonas_sp.AAC.1